MTESIIVERRVQKRLDADKVRDQINHFIKLSLSGTRGKGWTSKRPQISEPTKDSKSGEWLYRITVKFETTMNRQSVFDKFPRICQRFADAACAGQFRALPWKLISPAGYDEVANMALTKQDRQETIRVAATVDRKVGEICLDTKDHFDHIYNREPQIRRMMDAIRRAQSSGMQKRTHTLFDGPPGCGKTTIMKACSQMLGKEDEAYLWLDATSITKAGVIERLMDPKADVPPVCFIEEIEKCEETALRWSMGLMDDRGEIRRTNFRVGNQARNVRMVVIASANNIKLLKAMMGGALYSRFQNKIFCPRPDRILMQRILEREVRDIKGNPDWIEPTLLFAFDKWGMTDPREIIAVCSLGGDRLLDGTYQKDFEETMHPLERKELLTNLRRLRSKERTIRRGESNWMNSTDDLSTVLL